MLPPALRLGDALIDKVYFYYQNLIKHNTTGRLILDAIRNEGSLGNCIVSMNVGSADKLAMEGMQMPVTIESRVFLSWHSHPQGGAEASAAVSSERTSSAATNSPDSTTAPRSTHQMR